MHEKCFVTPKYSGLMGCLACLPPSAVRTSATVDRSLRPPTAPSTALITPVAWRFMRAVPINSDQEPYPLANGNTPYMAGWDVNNLRLRKVFWTKKHLLLCHGRWHFQAFKTFLFISVFVGYIWHMNDFEDWRQNLADVDHTVCLNKTNTMRICRIILMKIQCDIWSEISTA